MEKTLQEYLDVLKGKKFRLNHDMGRYTIYQLEDIYTHSVYPNTDLYAKLKVIESTYHGNVPDSIISRPLYELLANSEVKE